MSKQRRVWDFDVWFTAQHGKRTFYFPNENDKSLEEWIGQGERARKELQHRMRWDDKRTSALYAWQINDREKK